MMLISNGNLINIIYFKVLLVKSYLAGSQQDPHHYNTRQIKKYKMNLKNVIMIKSAMTVFSYKTINNKLIL